MLSQAVQYLAELLAQSRALQFTFHRGSSQDSAPSQHKSSLRVHNHDEYLANHRTLKNQPNSTLPYPAKAEFPLDFPFRVAKISPLMRQRNH